MDKLTVSLKIPIMIEHLIGAPGLIFSKWLPLELENGIVIDEEDFRITLWFDIGSVNWDREIPKEELSKHINVITHYMNAIIEVSIADKDLLSYINNKDHTRFTNDDEKELQQKYELLGTKILELTLYRVNRLISYARDVKGQYWIVKYLFNSNQTNNFYYDFEAKCRINEGDLKRFFPAPTDCFTIESESESRYISKDEWTNVCDFVRAKNKTPSFGELVSGAEQLLGNGYLRGAISEAVSALEVLIDSFKESEIANDKLSKLYSDRLGISNLKNQIAHLGITGTISYLLPLIIPETDLPKCIIKGCQSALKLRQNVIHNGQRNIELSEVKRSINYIRDLSEILNKYMK